MKKWLHNFLLVALAAAMMSFGWWRATGLVMLAGFVPLLVLAARYDKSARSWWAMLGWTTLFIVLWYAMTVWWVWFATPAGPIAATFFGWMYTGLAFMAWFFVSKRASKPLSYTVLVTVWTVGEWAYNHSQASFPWLNIGNGFANEPWLVQWYEYTGIYGGTIWVLVTSILIYEFLAVRKWAWKNLIVPACVLALPIVASVAIYFSYKEPARTTKTTIVQPNIESYTEKFVIPQAEQTANLIELAASAPSDVDFIVMPETAINESIIEGELEFSYSLNQIRGLRQMRYPGAMVVVGATTYLPYDTATEKPTKTARGNAQRGFYDVYNTALAILPGDTLDLHHKSRLVIGVEMMPDWWWVRATGVDKLVTDLGGMSGQLGYDTVRKVFATGEAKIGAAICYESIYGEYFADFVRGGAQAMMIITNDGWWRDTPGYRQHFDFARLRAIETRRAIARSANTGRSGFITSRGDVRETLGWDTRGAITDEIALNDKVTFYVRFGDYLCRICLLVLGLSMLYFVASCVRKRDLL